MPGDWLSGRVRPWGAGRSRRRDGAPVARLLRSPVGGEDEGSPDRSGCSARLCAGRRRELGSKQGCEGARRSQRVVHDRRARPAERTLFPRRGGRESLRAQSVAGASARAAAGLDGLFSGDGASGDRHHAGVRIGARSPGKLLRRQDRSAHQPSSRPGLSCRYRAAANPRRAGQARIPITAV